jgi:hypothetical protein
MTPDQEEALTSKELGLRMVPEGMMLRLYDMKTGEPILTRNERAEQEKRRAEQEKRRADALEAEVKRLREQLGQAKHRS